MDISGRFKKQIPFIGRKGHEAIRNSSLVIGGCSGSGTPLALLAALMGVGELILVDFDILEASNLNRFLLGGPEGVGRKKVEVARDYLGELVPSLRCRTISKSLKDEESVEALRGSDGILLGVDSEEVRTSVMKKCWELKKPIIDIASRSEINKLGERTMISRVMFWAPDIEGGCLLCLGVNPDDPSPSPPTSLVLPNVQAAAEGVLMFTSYLLELSSLHKESNLIYFDLLKPEVRALKVAGREECPICGKGKKRE